MNWFVANLVASVTIAIASVGLVFASLTYFGKRKQDSLSMRPRIQHEITQTVHPIVVGGLSGKHESSNRTMCSEWSIAIRNSGLGPAAIHRCEVGLNSGEFRPLNTSECEKIIDSIFPLPGPRPECVFAATGAGITIDKGTERVLVSFRARTPDELSALTHAVNSNEADLIVEYAAINGERFTYDTRDPALEPRRIRKG